MTLRLTGDAERDLDAVAAWLGADDPGPVVVATSGSSGTPKQVVLSRDAVLASARASAARLGGSGPWLLALPSSYVAAQGTVLQRRGRVYVTREADVVWVGGDTSTTITGAVAVGD